MNNKIEPSDITIDWALVMKLKDRALFEFILNND